MTDETPAVITRLQTWMRLIGFGATADRIERWKPYFLTDEALEKAIKEREKYQ